MKCGKRDLDLERNVTRHNSHPYTVDKSYKQYLLKPSNSLLAVVSWFAMSAISLRSCSSHSSVSFTSWAVSVRRDLFSSSSCLTFRCSSSRLIDFDAVGVTAGNDSRTSHKFALEYELPQERERERERLHMGFKSARKLRDSVQSIRKQKHFVVVATTAADKPFERGRW